jgi:hypothetical protein
MKEEDGGEKKKVRSWRSEEKGKKKEKEKKSLIGQFLAFFILPMHYLLFKILPFHCYRFDLHANDGIDYSDAIHGLQIADPVEEPLSTICRPKISSPIAYISPKVSGIYAQEMIESM